MLLNTPPSYSPYTFLLGSQIRDLPDRHSKDGFPRTAVITVGLSQVHHPTQGFQYVSYAYTSHPHLDKMIFQDSCGKRTLKQELQSQLVGALFGAKDAR